MKLSAFPHHTAHSYHGEKAVKPLAALSAQINHEKNTVDNCGQAIRLFTAVLVTLALIFCIFPSCDIENVHLGPAAPYMYADSNNLECAGNTIGIASADIIELDEALLGINDAPVSQAACNQLTDWMTQHYDTLANKTLGEICLPGTHDSGAFHFSGHTLYNVDKAVREIVKAAATLHIPVEKLIIAWSLAQDRTIRDQLMQGVRYLDLRVVWDGSDWRVMHGLTGVLVAEAIGDIADFVTKYPKEIVVVEVSAYDGTAGANACGLLDLIKQRLGAKLAIPHGAISEVKVGDLVNAHQSVVLVTNVVRAATESAWPAQAIHNTWADTPKLAEMIAYNEARASEATAWAAKDSLFKMSFTLTPQARDIVSSVLPGPRFRTLQELALQANGKLREFALEQRRQGRKLGHILIVDYWEQLSEVVSVAMNLSLATM